MGQTDSTPNYESEALSFYYSAVSKPCLLPDVGIDESLWKYSGSDSNAVLQVQSDMAKSVPGYVGRLGSVWGPMTTLPNAVGLGALVISLIIEIITTTSSTQKREHTYSLLQRVFGEEKASRVRDTMSEYLRRHDMYIDNEQRLLEEISRLEKQLSNDLTSLRNSLQLDGQMRTRGFKIWVNGAAFHVQMLIHEARLNIQTGKPAKDYLKAIEAAIGLYLQDLDNLLKKYKTYKVDSNIFRYRAEYNLACCYMTAGIHHPSACFMHNKDVKDCELEFTKYEHDCSDQKMVKAFMDVVYSNYEPIKGLESYFLNIKKNLNSIIRERGLFTVPSA